MIELTVHGVNAAIARNRKRLGKLGNLETAHLKAAILLQQWVLRNFKAEGTLHEDAGLYWRPLAPATIARRRKGRGQGSVRILQDTGRLRAGFIVSADQRHGMVKNAVPYAAEHESGGGRLPQRKMFPTEAQGLKIVSKIFHDHVRASIESP